jgi:hypothetical protein
MTVYHESIGFDDRVLDELAVLGCHSEKQLRAVGEDPI